MNLAKCHIHCEELPWNVIESRFQWKLPCHPTDLVYFRQRIGKEGSEWLFSMSVSVNPDAEPSVVDRGYREAKVDPEVELIITGNKRPRKDSKKRRLCRLCRRLVTYLG